jgi:hypothetical protein
VLCTLGICGSRPLVEMEDAKTLNVIGLVLVSRSAISSAVIHWLIQYLWTLSFLNVSDSQGSNLRFTIALEFGFFQWIPNSVTVVSSKDQRKSDDRWKRYRNTRFMEGFRFCWKESGFVGCVMNMV